MIVEANLGLWTQCHQGHSARLPGEHNYTDRYWAIMLMKDM